MFLTNGFRAASGHLSPNNDALFNIGGQLSAAGMRVSPETAMRLSVVYACVRTIAEAVGQLPLHIYRRQGRRKTFATDHPLYALLHRRPNRWQTSAEWRETVAAHVVLRGNSYNEIVTAPNGLVTALVPHNPDYVTPKANRLTGAIQYALKQPDGSDRILQADQVLHFRGVSSNGFIGMNPIEEEREALGFGLATQEYGARFYQNGASMPGWIEHPSNFKTAEDKTQFRGDWRTMTVGGNRFTTPVLEYGMKYHELAIKHTDMQYLETRKHSDVEIARIFKVPPHMVGILDRATWGNMEQQALEFVIHTMMPLLVKMEQGFEGALFHRIDDHGNVVEDSEHFVKFSVAGLLRGDARTRAQFYGFGIKDGWLTRNEARELEDLNPLDGLDEPLQPLNMAAGSDRQWDDGDSGKPKKDKSGDDRAARMALAAAQRIVNKECIAMRRAYDRCIGRSDGPNEFRVAVEELYATHADQVAAMLAINHDIACRYAAESAREMQAALDTEVREKRAVIPDLLAEWERSKAQWLVNFEG